MLFVGPKSRRIVVASRSRWLCKTAAKADVLGKHDSLGWHEYANRLRPHAGSMGNVKGASRSGSRAFQTESFGSRAADRGWARCDDRQLAGHDAGRAQDPDTRLIQIVGRCGLTSGLSPSRFQWNQIPDAKATLPRCHAALWPTPDRYKICRG